MGPLTKISGPSFWGPASKLKQNSPTSVWELTNDEIKALKIHRSAEAVPQMLVGPPRKRITTKGFSSGATALQGLGRQSGRRRSAKLVPTFADRRVSRGQCNGSPRPLISVYRTWIATYFIQVAPQLTSRGSRGWVHPFQTHCHSENLVAPGIEPETSVSVARNPDH